MEHNRKLFVSLGALFVIIFIALIFVNVLMVKNNDVAQRAPVSDTHLQSTKAASFNIEIEDDGDININGKEVFDPEDVAKKMIINHAMKGSTNTANVKVTPTSVELTQKRIGEVVKDTDGAKKVIFKDNPNVPLGTKTPVDVKTQGKVIMAPAGEYPRKPDTVKVDTKSTSNTKTKK